MYKQELQPYAIIAYLVTIPVAEKSNDFPMFLSLGRKDPLKVTRPTKNRVPLPSIAAFSERKRVMQRFSSCVLPGSQWPQYGI